MSRDKVLPPKLSIKEIQSYLDMGYGYAAYQQLCDHVNAKDFKLYLHDETEVKQLAYTTSSLFNPTGLDPFLAGDKHYTEDHFHANRDEIMHYRKLNLQGDFLPADPVVEKFTPPYLDKEGDYYAEELDLAIQLHHAIHIEKYGNVQQSIKERVDSWLSTKKPDLPYSDNRSKRLSAIIGIKNK